MEILMKNNQLNKILESFSTNAEIYGQAVLIGDSKTANKAYSKIIKYKDRILSENMLDSLSCFLNVNSIPIKIWAARYLLFSPLYSNESEALLRYIHENENSLLGTIAEQTLKEWEQGRLTLEY